MTFRLVRVCENCPFRKDDKAIDLAPGRREQIITDLLNGTEMSFSCHKTIYEANSAVARKRAVRSVCAGAAAVCEKFGRKMTIIQVAERMGAIGEDHYERAKEDTIEPGDLDIDRKKAHI